MTHLSWGLRPRLCYSALSALGPPELRDGLVKLESELRLGQILGFICKKLAALAVPAAEHRLIELPCRRDADAPSIMILFVISMPEDLKRRGWLEERGLPA